MFFQKLFSLKLQFLLKIQNDENRYFMQNRDLYKKIIFDLILEYNIRVKRWRNTNSGWAYFTEWEVEIPKPITLAKFITCAHEIGHLVKDKASNPIWKSEYIATKFAFDVCEKNNIIVPENERLNNLNYLLSCISEDLIENNVNFKTIDKHVIEYANIDVKLWKSKIKKGYLPEVHSVKTNDGFSFYKIKVEWIKVKAPKVTKKTAKNR